jgi:hypothetical protein
MGPLQAADGRDQIIQSRKAARNDAVAVLSHVQSSL